MENITVKKYLKFLRNSCRQLCNGGKSRIPGGLVMLMNGGAVSQIHRNKQHVWMEMTTVVYVALYFTLLHGKCIPSIIDHFYRAMHFSAKRGIAIACRLSLCPFVCM